MRKLFWSAGPWKEMLFTTAVRSSKAFAPPGPNLALHRSKMLALPQFQGRFVSAFALECFHGLNPLASLDQLL